MDKTYLEFKSAYKWSIKKYPCIDSLCNYSAFIRLEKTSYSRTEPHTKWIETDRKTELVDIEFYLNTIEAIPFFKAIGGKELVDMSYTKAGYIPTRVNSLSPSRTEKIVYRFIFEA